MAESDGAVRTRRAVLLGAFGAVAALAAQAVGRPEAVRAATDDQAVHKGVNNPTSATTTITNTSGSAIKGVTNTSAQNMAGVIGTSNSPHASGVFGQGVFGVSGFGTGNTGAGVIGSSSKPGGFGVEGLNQSASGDATGVKGESKSNDGIGVLGFASSALGTNRRGVVGRGGDVGVVGDGDTGVLGLGEAIGVEGTVINTDGIAIKGDVSGLGASSIGGSFIGGGPNHSLALRTQGPIRFAQSSGVATIAASATFVNATVPYCPTGSKIFATLQQQPGVTNKATVQTCARVNDTTIEILLTQATTDAVDVAWFIIV